MFATIQHSLGTVLALRGLLPRLTTVVLGLVLCLVWGGPVAAGPCSSYLGRATINEVFQASAAQPFVEVKLLDVSIGPAVYNNWTVTVCNSKEGCVSRSVSTGIVDDTYIVVKFTDRKYFNISPTGSGSGTDVLLTDSAGKPIDYLSVAGYTLQQPASCNFDYDTDHPGTSSFGIGRLPDATGDWAPLGPGNSEPPTENNPNTSDTGPDGNPVPRVGIANLSIAKGQTADFVVTLYNASGIPQTFSYDAVIEYDTLDDTAFSDLTVAPPDHDYSYTAGTLTIPAGSGSGIISVPTNASSPSPDGVVFWLRIRNPAGAAVPAIILNYFASATISGVLGAADHFALSHDGNAINCQAEPITLAAHDSAHNPVAGYIGTVALTTSTGHGDWTLLSGVAGNLSNLGNGQGSYQFDGSEGGQVVLGLKNPYAEILNIDAVEGATAVDPGEDPNLAFAAAGFNVLADAVVNAIGSQIAGKPSDQAPGAQLLELQAIRTSDQTGACEAALVGNNAVELAFECLDPGSCSASQLTVGGSPVAGNDNGAPLSYSAVSLDFGDATDSTAALLISYPDAGRLRLHARYVIPLDDGSGTPSPVSMIGASNDFVVRPFALQVSAVGNPAASSAAGAVYTSAGSDFTAQVRAVRWQAADDADGDGAPDGHGDLDPGNNADLSDNGGCLNFGQEASVEGAVLSAALALPAGGINPGLSGTTTLNAFAGGSDSGVVQFAEVGIIELRAALADGDYLGLGALETARMIGRTGYVGRFVPHHFDVTVQPGCGSFNYSGQPWDHPADAPLTGVTATARNLAGLTTSNYHGPTGFAKPTTFSDVLTGSVNFSNNTLAGADFVNGVGLDSDIRYTFATPETAPLTLTLRGVDTDGVSSAGFAEETVEIRSGRLALSNAFGSELVDLPVPLQTEYYLDAATGFVLNTADGCSSVPLTLLSLTSAEEAGIVASNPIRINGGITTQASLANDPLLAGEAGLVFAAPGAGGDGYVDIDIDLSGQDWLRYDWNGDSVADDPAARVTFGIYKGHPRLIQLRELVQ